MSKRENCSVKEKKQGIVLNEKIRDSSSKIIFDDSILCAQFMKDYVDGLKNVEIYPENIEDVSERFVPLIAEERNSDTVKKIKIPNKTPFYFISLIEHKTQVDYNVAIQIFRYIYQIWEDYEKEMEAKQKGISKTKIFQYPPVIPIVYYEGNERWTAPMELKEKISMQEMFGDMIPNFTYQLVRLNDYSNEELLDKGDAISLMMMINKIKNHKDVEQFMRLPSGRIEEIIQSMPNHLVKKIAQIFRVLLFSMNTPEDEVEEIVSRVEEKSMARLFEGMQIDVQADRRRRAEEEERIRKGNEELARGNEELARGKEELARGNEEFAAAKKQFEEERRQLEFKMQQLIAEKEQFAKEKEQFAREKEQLQRNAVEVNKE